MEATMSARTGRILLALALAPALAMAQDRAVPRESGGGGGGGSRGGGGDAGSRHTSPSSGGSSSSYSGSSGGGATYHTPSTAERRHPRAGTGRGEGGYYPGYGYPPGYWGGGYYYPGYGGYWWPYGYYGWYGGFGYGSYWGYPGYGGTVYHSGGGRDGASLRVLVDPSEARVYVDGYYAGVVDDFDGLFQRLNVAPGRHDVTLKLEGYKSHRMRVYVGPDATLKLHHEMQKGVGETFEDLSGGAPPPERETRRERDEDEDDDADEPAAVEQPSAEFGKLQLTVEPEDASVYVDGAFRGTGREASSLKLAPGRHRIEVVRPGFRTAENEIDVPAGETTRIRVILDRPSI
jgi:hypothetical protein